MFFQKLRTENFKLKLLLRLIEMRDYYHEQMENAQSKVLATKENKFDPSQTHLTKEVWEVNHKEQVNYFYNDKCAKWESKLAVMHIIDEVQKMEL